MSLLIGIVGFINSGKGTVGDYLISDYQFKGDSFAAPLKDAVSVIFGWDREMLEGQSSESRVIREQPDEYWSEVLDREMTPRLALQLFGTECIRNVFHPNVWSASLIKRYKTWDRNVVVTDCRFKNEIAAIRKIGGKVIRVKRGPEPDWYDYYINLVKSYNVQEIERLRKTGELPHVSETDWIGTDFDYVINNDGTLDDLYNEIDNIMEDIRS
jgi:hypothetical protein